MQLTFKNMCPNSFIATNDDENIKNIKSNTKSIVEINI